MAEWNCNVISETIPQFVSKNFLYAQSESSLPLTRTPPFLPWNAMSPAFFLTSPSFPLFCSPTKPTQKPSRIAPPTEGNQKASLQEWSLNSNCKSISIELIYIYIISEMWFYRGKLTYLFLSAWPSRKLLGNKVCN